MFSIINDIEGKDNTKSLPNNIDVNKLPDIFLNFLCDKIQVIRRELDNCVEKPKFEVFKGKPLLSFSAVCLKDRAILLKHAMNKTCSLDPISNELLKTNSESIAQMEIINISLLTDVLPQDLKNAFVIPILKKHGLDGNILKNYRPVSNLPFVSKILERVVLTQLQKHLEENELSRNINQLIVSTTLLKQLF